MESFRRCRSPLDDPMSRPSGPDFRPTPGRGSAVTRRCGLAGCPHGGGSTALGRAIRGRDPPHRRGRPTCSTEPTSCRCCCRPVARRSTSRAGPAASRCGSPGSASTSSRSMSHRVAIELTRSAAAAHDLAGRIDARVVDLDDGLPADLHGVAVVVCQRFRGRDLYGPIVDVLQPGGVAIVTVLSVVGVDGTARRVPRTCRRAARRVHRTGGRRRAPRRGERPGVDRGGAAPLGVGDQGVAEAGDVDRARLRGGEEVDQHVVEAIGCLDLREVTDPAQRPRAGSTRSPHEQRGRARPG